MKNIVVPIDFSDDSLNALEHAILIANKFKASITITHVKKKKEFFTNKLGIESFQSTDDSQVMAYFDKIHEKIKDQVENHIEYKLLKGKIYQEVILQAKKSDAFMIIMGTHGVSGFEERWIGSNAYRVVSNAPCPVITIRMDYMLKSYKKIIVPIDTTDETRQKIPFLANFAHLFDSEICLMSLKDNSRKEINKKLNNYIRQAEEYLEKAKVRFQTERMEGKNLADLVIEHALETGAHLIGTMSEITERSRNIFISPAVQHLVNHSPIPIICFQPY